VQDLRQTDARDVRTVGRMTNRPVLDKNALVVAAGALGLAFVDASVVRATYVRMGTLRAQNEER
jgi:hypothetical protein